VKLRHKVKINVADTEGNKQEVLRSTHVRLPERLLKFLFGDWKQVVVLVPGESVEGITIQEVRNGGAQDA